MPSDQLRGKRYVNYLRCSTTMQETSIFDQRLRNNAFANEHEMVWVRDVELDGVSGSTTDNPELDALLVECETLKHIDVIIVHDWSRLTRAGLAHGNKIRAEFAKLGILIVAATEPLPEGDIGELVAGLIDFKNQAHVKRLAEDITRGIIRYIAREECEHHGPIPYAVDRLYVRIDGTPFLRLVYGSHRSRVLIDTVTGKIIRTFDPKTDRNTAYRKMKGERVHLVPSDEARVEIVRWIFTQRYRHNWAYCRIAIDLNNRGIPPLKGMNWTSATIRQMLLQPMYLGWSYSFKTVSGKFFEAGGEAPVKTSKPAASRRRLKAVAEMLRMTHPYLCQFITDEDVRAKADVAITEFYQKHHIRKEVSSVVNEAQNPESSFILRDVLTDSEFGRKLRGRPTKNRYYGFRNPSTFAPKGSIARRTVPAESLENVLLDVLRHVFSSADRVQSAIQGFVNRTLAEQPEAVDRNNLENEQREIGEKLAFIYATSDVRQLKELRPHIQQLQSRRNVIERELSCKPIATLTSDSANIAERIYAALPSQLDKLDGAGFEKLRLLINVVCRRFVVDLGTREADVEMALPEVFVRVAQHAGLEVCTRQIGDHLTTRRAHEVRWLPLGRFRLTAPAGPLKWIGTVPLPYTWVEIDPDPSDRGAPRKAA